MGKKDSSSDSDPDDGKFACCGDLVATLSVGNATCCCILNCIPFLSGWGTMFSSSSCCSAIEDKRCKIFWLGFLQWFLAHLTFIGYIWSIIHGCSLIRRAKMAEHRAKKAKNVAAAGEGPPAPDGGNVQVIYVQQPPSGP